MPQGQMIYNTIDRATPDAFGGQVLKLQQMTDQANHSVVFNALTGPNPVSSWQEFNSDPKRKDAFNALYKTDASIRDRVDRAISINVWRAWDPPATQQTNNLYTQLDGMSATDRVGFSKLDLKEVTQNNIYNIPCHDTMMTWRRD